jgi:hypothetical protein
VPLLTTAHWAETFLTLTTTCLRVCFFTNEFELNAGDFGIHDNLRPHLFAFDRLSSLLHLTTWEDDRFAKTASLYRPWQIMMPNIDEILRKIGRRMDVP